MSGRLPEFPGSPRVAAMVLPIQAGASNPAALDPVARIDGPFWTWVVPIALFAVALGATLLLYRHFVSRSEEDR